MNDRQTILASAVGFIVLAAAILIAYNSPATGYEKSIYESTPLLFWVFFAVIMLLGTAILVAHAFHQRQGKSWAVAFVLLIAANAVFLSLPAIRGYEFIGKGDALAHMGMIVDISQTNHIYAENIYPITHIVVSQIATILRVSEFTVGLYIPAIFTTLYMVFLLVLAKTLTLSKGKLLLAVASSAVLLPLGSGAVLPQLHVFSLFCLFSPIILAVYLGTLKPHQNRVGYKISFILLLVLLSFVHQLLVLFILLIMVSIEITKFVLRRTTLAQQPANMYSISETIITPILILLFISFLWFSSFEIFAVEMEHMQTQLFGEIENSTTVHVQERLDEVKVHGIELISLAFKLFGDAMIYVLASMVYLFMMFKDLLKTKTYNFSELALAMICLSSMLYFPLALGSQLTASAFREIKFVMIPITVFGGFGLYVILDRYLIKTKLKILLGIMVIIVVISFSVYSTYRSPHILTPSNHITCQDMTGSKWLLETKDNAIGTISMSTTWPRRFSDAIAGYEFVEQNRLDIQHSFFLGPEDYIMDYGLNHSFGSDKYLVLTERDKYTYTELWNDLNSEHFDELFYQSSIDRVYSNGEMEIWGDRIK